MPILLGHVTLPIFAVAPGSTSITTGSAIPITVPKSMYNLSVIYSYKMSTDVIPANLLVDITTFSNAIISWNFMWITGQSSVCYGKV